MAYSLRGASIKRREAKASMAYYSDEGLPHDYTRE